MPAVLKFPAPSLALNHIPQQRGDHYRRHIHDLGILTTILNLSIFLKPKVLDLQELVVSERV